MSGHSKWATTKRQKEANDSKRSAIFTRMANLISIAARKGGDQSINFALRLAVEKAKKANMPKDNIERAIKRGTGELEGKQIEELNYEAVGPVNTQFVVKCLTDNKNRTASEIRHLFSKHNGSLGSVIWNFEQKGIILVSQEELTAKKIDFDSLEMDLIEAGAEDILKEDEGVTIYAKVADLQAVKSFLEDKGLELETAEIGFVAKEKIEIKDEDERNKVEKLIEALDDYEDISDYYTNLKN